MKRLFCTSILALFLTTIAYGNSFGKQKKEHATPKRESQNNETTDCRQFFGKGYCVDYIHQRYRNAPSGNASTWPSTVKDKYSVQKGDVAIFRSAASGVGHVALVENVNHNRKTIDVSEMNWGVGKIDACSRVDGAFNKVSYRRNIPISSVSGFWRP